MVTTHDFAAIIAEISPLMTANRDLLISLDQVNGDGDLGISMDEGFRALTAYFEDDAPDDLGQALRQGAKVLNSAAPSSLGTILSFALMGMAKALRGKVDVDAAAAAAALVTGVETIMAKAESEPGQKTILDSLHPGAHALRDGLEAGKSSADAARSAADAAAAGSEATKEMTAVHGRAAYSASRSLGVLDGGSVVGKLIFDGIAKAVDDRA